MWRGALDAELTLENGYDLFGFHGRVVGIVCFLVDDFHALGLRFILGRSRAMKGTKTNLDHDWLWSLGS